MEISTEMPDETDDQDHAAHDGPNGGVIVEDPAMTADLQELGDGVSCARARTLS